MDWWIPAVATLVLLAAVTLVLVGRRRRAGIPAAKGLAGGMEKSSRSLAQAIRSVFSPDAADGPPWQSLEDALISADVGVKASATIVDRVRGHAPTDHQEARDLLRREILSLLEGKDRSLNRGGKPMVILVVGVNGVGKTTSIAKLANRLAGEGANPILGAADTFRAAADAQLRTWADRLGVPVVGGQEGADPAAVAFDAYQAARARDHGVVIIDTAGRQHAKESLMAELSKIRRVVEREAGRIDEVLLVLDATTGQNGIAQVREFVKAVGVSGIILTKLDGTSRGGIVVAVEDELGVPVKLVGVGEGIDDLVPFNPEEFVDELLLLA